MTKLIYGSIITSKRTWKWRQIGVAYPYMGATRHFHVVGTSNLGLAASVTIRFCENLGVTVSTNADRSSECFIR
jgi:hypothetical protein